MSRTSKTVAVLCIVVACSTPTRQLFAQAAVGRSYPADGRIVLADSASDRARQEALRRQEDQRRQEEQRRREEQRREQEEERQRVEEKRKAEAADEAAAKKKLKEEAAVAAQRQHEAAAKQKLKEEAAVAAQRQHEAAAKQKREEATAAAQRSASVPATPAAARPIPAPIHNGFVPDHSNRIAAPQGGLPAPGAAPIAGGAAASNKGGYADRQYAGPSGQNGSTGSGNPAAPTRQAGIPEPGSVITAPGLGPVVRNPGTAYNGPVPPTANRVTAVVTAPGTASGEAAAGSVVAKKPVLRGPEQLEAVAVCWQSKRNKDHWRCDGPLQDTILSDEALDVQLGYAGCEKPRATDGSRTITSRSGSVGEVIVHLCGYGLYGGDYDVAKKYGFAVQRNKYQCTGSTYAKNKCKENFQLVD